MRPMPTGISMGLALFCSLKTMATDACFGSNSSSGALQGSNGFAQPYYPPAAECHEFMIPVTITSTGSPFNGTKWATDYDFQDFISLATTRPSAGYPGVLSAPVSTTATYNIAASFCTPKQKNSKSKTVIFATHGIGPARAHWNSPFRPDEFNFVQHAIGEGYSVFFYDRLGTGASQKVSGYENQLTTASAVIRELSAMVRSGQYTGSLGKPDKLAVMGFSYGSYATHTAIIEDPKIADAVILTAIGFNKTGLNVNGLVRSFQLRIAAAQNPFLYGELDTGYVTWVDQYAQIENYFKKPNYDAATAAYAEAAKNPFAITEFLTLLAGPTDASNFTGPVLGITGEFDYIFCDGLCDGLLDEPAKEYYTNANYTGLMHPGASHNINLHKNATGAYKAITDFLGSNGL